MTQDSIDRRRIAELAFDLWCKRGRPIGSAQVDWERGYQRHLRQSRTEAIDPISKVFVP